MNNIMINASPNHYRSESSSEEEIIPKDQAVRKRAADAYLRVVPSQCMKNIEESNSIDMIALCGIAKYNAKIYCGSSEKKRTEIYKQENKNEYKEISKKTHIRVLKEDAAKNSTVMAASVCGMGLIGSLGWLAGPAGGIAGTTLGIASGFVVGGVIIHNFINKKVNIEIQFSDHYAQWRNRAIIEKVYPIFRNFVDADTEFEDFMCPIAQDICSVPMLAPDGRTYNQKDIYEYISYNAKSDDQKVRSPIRGKPFSKNDLVIDSNYCRKLIEKSEKTYKDIIEYGNESAVEHGMKAVIKNTQELMENIRVQVQVSMYLELNKEIDKGNLTEKERDEMIALGTKQWDFRDRIK